MKIKIAFFNLSQFVFGRQRTEFIFPNISGQNNKYDTSSLPSRSCGPCMILQRLQVLPILNKIITVTIVVARKILLRSSLLVRKKVGKQNQKMLVHYMYVAAAVVSLWKSLNEICSHVCNCCITKLLLFLVFYSFIITYFWNFLQSSQPDVYTKGDYNPQWLESIDYKNTIK